MAQTKTTKEKGDKSSKDPASKKAKGKAKDGKDKAKVEVVALPKGYIPRMKKLYDEQIRKLLKDKFEYKNPMLIPKIEKIVLNVGAGTIHQEPKLAESIADELSLVTGQKPVFTKARHSISNFKLRQGMTVGCRVTLRGAQMYEFFDRLVSVVIPRIRDFRGLSEKSFDGRGNYSFGVREQIIFPEIDYDKVVKIHGMDINIATTARSDEEAFELLRGFGFPFRRRVESDQDAA